MKSLTFITGNLNKVKWTQRYIHIPLEHKKLDLTEIQSLDVYEVVEYKVKEAYEIVKKPVLVEDTSLVCHALGKLPGPFIKWFLEELGTEGLCKLINNNRKATATVVFGLFDGKNLRMYEGTVDGTIAEKPRGQNGFGWDPIFIPKGQKKTHGEMTPEEMDKINIRRIALEKMEKDK
jgi:non-canonical purine NTP pyrophosphatase (RdgB/HAM1 family)